MDSQSDFSYEKLSRRDFRALVINILYAADANDYQLSLPDIVQSFNSDFSLDIPLDSRLVKVCNGVIEQRAALDELIKPLLNNWRFERISICTKLILRLAFWELMHTDVPTSIIINEAIELAKSFSEEGAAKFVNGIIDEATKKYPRPIEPSAG